ncbi:MAG: hypothetical protein R3D60_03500 [Paracoccaceae bacterium]
MRFRLALAMRSLAVALALALAPAPAAVAQDIPGSDDPAFQLALAEWLADDEAEALPRLGTLARAGNASARLLLGLIDRTPSLQGVFLARLPRADRIALLRDEGGMSGRNWLHTLDAVPLAQTWNDLFALRGGPELIARFDALGDPRAAREAMITLSAREHPRLRDLDPALLDYELLYLLWPVADDDQRAIIENRVGPDHPQRALIGQRPDVRVTDLWLRESPVAEPLRSVCAAVCPEAADQPACQSAAYQALGSHNGLLALGTPAEALVPQDVFLNSERGRNSTIRRILLGRDMRARRLMMRDLQDRSACLWEALHTQALLYRPNPPSR